MHAAQTNKPQSKCMATMDFLRNRPCWEKQQTLCLEPSFYAQGRYAHIKSIVSNTLWSCSSHVFSIGAQSNMVHPVSYDWNASEQLAALEALPHLRFFQVGRQWASAGEVNESTLPLGCDDNGSIAYTLKVFHICVQCLLSVPNVLSSRAL